MFHRVAAQSGVNTHKRAAANVAVHGPKALFRDPVCGTYVAEDISYLLTQSAEDLHFCSRDCMERYQHDFRARHDRGSNQLAPGA